MAVADYRREIADLKPGTHLLGLFASEDEQRAWVIPFLIAGLETGEKVLYIHDSRAPEAIQEELGAAGVEVSAVLESGQLSFVSARAALLYEDRFEPELAVRNLEAQIAEAVEQGYGALRLTAEMSWALSRKRGCARFVEYECKCNALFPESRGLALCQYDLQRFTPQQLLEVLAVHPEVLSGEGRHENLYYTEPSHVGAKDAAHTLLRRRLGRMDAWGRKRRAQSCEVERIRKTLDAVAVAVVALDREGRVAFINETGEQVFGHRAEQIRGQVAWELLVGPEQRTHLQQLFREAWLQGEAQGQLGLHAVGQPGRRTLETFLRRVGDSTVTEQVILTVAGYNHSRR